MNFVSPLARKILLGLLAVAVLVGFIFSARLGLLPLEIPYLTASGQVAKQASLLSGFYKYADGKVDAKAINTQANEAVTRQKIIAAETTKRGITVSKDDIDKEWKARVTLFNGNEPYMLDYLKKYGWTEEDLRQQIAAQLLEKKLRGQMEGQITFRFIAFFPPQEQEKFANDLAKQAASDLNSGKSFDEVLKQASASATARKFGVQYSPLQDIPILQLEKGWPENLATQIKALPENGTAVLDGPGFTLTVHVLKNHPGLDFEKWIQDQKVKTTFYLIKPAWALNPCPFGNNQWCRGNVIGEGSACIDPTHIGACGNISAFVCSNPSQTCKNIASNLTVLCVSLAGFGGLVRDAATKLPLPGVSVNAYNNTAGCSGGNYSNHSLSSTSDSYQNYQFPNYDIPGQPSKPFNCSGGPVTVTFYKANYNSATITVPITNNVYSDAPPVDLVSGTGSPPPPPPPPPPVTCGNFSGSASPNPIAGGANFTISMVWRCLTSCMDGSYPGFYQNVGVNLSGGASCGYDAHQNINWGAGQVEFHWDCTANNTSSTNTYTATYADDYTRAYGDPGCSLSYTTYPGCSHTSCNSSGCPAGCGNHTCTDECGDEIISCGACTPCAPGLNLIFPPNGATSMPKNLSLQWSLSSWGSVCSVTGSNQYTVDWRDMTAGEGWGNHRTGYVTNNLFYSHALSNLVTGHTYAWNVIATNQGGQSTTSPTWTFTVLPQSWMQVSGGDMFGASIYDPIQSNCGTNNCFINVDN